MPLDMTKLNLIAQEWDPTPFLKASEQALAMQQLPTTQPDLAGQAPGGMPGMSAPSDWSALAMEGSAPGGNPMAALPPGMLQAASQQPQQQVARAPAAAPRKGPQMQFPGLPQIGKVPSLKDLLGGM